VLFHLEAEHSEHAAFEACGLDPVESLLVGGMGFDVDAALADWAAASERIWAEVQQRILDEQAELVEQGLKTRDFRPPRAQGDLFD